jgi:hypothetical protein
MVRFPVAKIGLTVLEIVAQVGFAAVGLIDFCHVRSPVKPVNAIVVPVPEHNEETAAVAVPAVADVAIVYFTTFVSEVEHAPLFTTALKKVVPVMLFTEYELAVPELETVENVGATALPFGTFIKLVPSVEYIHWIVPLFPAIFNSLLDPEQNVPPPVIVPATDIGLTVMVFTALLAMLQAPLVTTERT